MLQATLPQDSMTIACVLLPVRQAMQLACYGAMHLPALRPLDAAQDPSSEFSSFSRVCLLQTSKLSMCTLHGYLQLSLTCCLYTMLCTCHVMFHQARQTMLLHSSSRVQLALCARNLRETRLRMRLWSFCKEFGTRLQKSAGKLSSVAV